MQHIQKIYICGLGAIGAAYAGRLHQAYPGSVRIIADRERVERYSKSGIDINGSAVFFNYLLPEEAAEPADLVLVAVKHHHLAQAIHDMKKFIGPDTVILSLLNGITSEEILGREFGAQKVLFAMCVGIDAQREGTHVRYTNIGRIEFGEEKNLALSPRVSAVKKLFDGAAIPCAVPEDMIRTLWWKFMINVGINQTSAVLKAPYGVFQTMKEAGDLMEAAMAEVVDLSVKAGINLNREDMMEFTRVLHTLAPQGKTSMLQDMEAGRKTEVEIFAGTVIELGKKYGMPTPVNEMLFKMIRVLEKIGEGSFH